MAIIEAYQDDDESSLLDAVFALGINFFVQGKYEKAEIIFDGLLALDPNFLEAQVAYGEVLLAKENFEDALTHFVSALNVFKQDSRIRLGAARACILLHKHVEAQNFLNPIIGGEIHTTPSMLSIALHIYKNTKSSM